jgi:hypothetical protein
MLMEHRVAACSCYRIQIAEHFGIRIAVPETVAISVSCSFNYEKGFKDTFDSICRVARHGFQGQSCDFTLFILSYLRVFETTAAESFHKIWMRLSAVWMKAL